MKNKRVIVGMSGGVDSSVTALLLLEQGYQVEGLFMKNWEEDPGVDDDCSADQDLIDAQAVALKIGIRLHTVNFSQEYWDRVFSYFLEEYEAGRTPNPDIMCNQEIKFKAFLDYALGLNADFIATGHYVRKTFKDNKYWLLKGLDKNKDQSYFLYRLSQRALKYSLFPIGELEKSKVRDIAEQHGFRNHAKKDSTGICFIGERRFREFLANYLPAKAGPIKTEDGKVVGQHQGSMYYTIGQRQGLGVGGTKDGNETPWYVAEKNTQENTLIVVQGHDHPLLHKQSLTANRIHWIAETPQLPMNAAAKTRYRQQDQSCTAQQAAAEQLTVTFDVSQRAITPGQSVVFYEDDICLGGAIICD